MPKLNTSSFAEQKALMVNLTDQLKHDRHAGLLFSAIEHFIKIYQSNHHKKQLFSYLDNHLAKLEITGFMNPDNPPSSTALASLKNALVALNQAQLDQLDHALFSQEAFKSISTQKTFIDVLEIWQNKYPPHRRFGRLYSAMPEELPHTPAVSLKHYYQTLLTDLQHYHSMKKEDLSSCYEKIHSLCSNLIVLEHLQHLDSHFQTPNLPLNEKIALIQLTHDDCLSYFIAPLESSTLSHEDKQDLKVSFSQLMWLILSQYLDDRQFSIFTSEPAEHLRQALITCCIEMQDRTSPKNKQGKTKKRTSTYNGKKHPNFMQCQETIEAAIQTFQQQDLASTGVFFYQGNNINPDFVITFIQQHWRHHQHSEHFQNLLQRYWQHFSETLNPLWESTSSNTDEQFNHTVCTHLYNFLLPEIENIHRIALVLDCIQEASTLPKTSEVELARLRGIKDLIELKINQKFDLIASDLNDELLRFFGHTEDPLSLHKKWYSMPTQDIQLESAQSIQAIRTLLLDSSGEKRQALMAEIINQYKDEANKDRSDKRAACQGMIQVIQRSLSTANHIAEICWRYTQDLTRQKTQEITASGYFIPNIDQKASISAVVPGCFGPHDLTKGQSVFKKGINGLQPPQEPLWKTDRYLAQQDNGNSHEEYLERQPSTIPEAPPYLPPAPPTLGEPNVTSSTEGRMIEAPQQLLGDGLDTERHRPIDTQHSSIEPFSEERMNLSTEKTTAPMTAPHKTIIPPPPPPPPLPQQPYKEEKATLKTTSHALTGVKEGEAVSGTPTDVRLIAPQNEQDEPRTPPRESNFAELLQQGAKQLKSAEKKPQSQLQETSKNRSGLFAHLEENIAKRRSSMQGTEPLLNGSQRNSMSSTGSGW